MVMSIKNLDDQILYALYSADQHMISEVDGFATRAVSERVGYLFEAFPPKKSVGEELRKLDQSGFIKRDTNAKRTYSVSLAQKGIDLVQETMLPSMDVPRPATEEQIAETAQHMLEETNKPSVAEVITQALEQVHELVDENHQLEARNAQLVNGLIDIADILHELMSIEASTAEADETDEEES